MNYNDMNKRVICIGTAIVDCIIKDYDPVPVSPGRTCAGSTILSCGGEAVNQSITLAKLGYSPMIICGLGQDGAAALLRNELDKYSVNTELAVTGSEVQTPVTVMILDDKGDRTSITNNAHRFNIHPEANMDYLENASAISLGSLFRAPFDDPDIIYSVVHGAHERGIPVFADTKLPNFTKLTLEDIKEALPFIDYVFPNEAEGEYYTGCKDPEQMADVLLGYGVRNVIIKLGDKGCLLKNHEETIRLDACKVQAIDATGAGDNFIAGFITRRLAGASNREALIYANACGAICATCVGATTALTDHEQVMKLLGRYNDR